MILPNLPAPSNFKMGRRNNGNNGKRSSASTSARHAAHASALDAAAADAGAESQIMAEGDQEAVEDQAESVAAAAVEDQAESVAAAAQSRSNTNKEKELQAMQKRLQELEKENETLKTVICKEHFSTADDSYIQPL
jgi:hypothetical protein